MLRYSRWPTLLEAYLQSASSREFEYGVFDCALFTADCILAMTGVDIAECLRDYYSSRREALQAIAALSGAPTIQSIACFVAARYKLPEVPVQLASRGDLVLIPRQRGRDHSLGIVSLTGRTVLMALKVGYGHTALNRASRAWHI